MAVRAVTIGFFDGVHIGHRRVLNTLLSKGGDASVVTFWPHPRAVLQKDARNLFLLNSLEEKREMISSIGVKDIECVEFTKEFAALTAGDFIRNYLIGELGCTHLVLGYDNRFGSDGLSTPEVADLARSMGLDVEVVEPCTVGDVQVSSTVIRAALAQGDVSRAALMLGAPYSIKGMVVPGNRLGRTIGFPTANTAPSFPLKAIPANGVYATVVEVGGRKFKGMTNVGTRPTVSNSQQRVIETNIFDFEEDIYGLEITLNFISRIRQEQKFEGVEQLKLQLEKDRQSCLDLFGE